MKLRMYTPPLWIIIILAILVTGCASGIGTRSAENVVNRFIEAVKSKDIDTIAKSSESQVFLWDLYFVTHDVFVNELWKSDLDNDFYGQLIYTITSVKEVGSGTLVEVDTAYYRFSETYVTQLWWFTVNDKGLIVGFDTLQTN